MSHKGRKVYGAKILDKKTPKIVLYHIIWYCSVLRKTIAIMDVSPQKKKNHSGSVYFNRLSRYLGNRWKNDLNLVQ